MADYIALAIAVATALCTVIYNRHKARTDASKVALNGFGALTKTLQDEIGRLRVRVAELESKQDEWELERTALLGRIDALETENKQLRSEMDRLKKGSQVVAPSSTLTTEGGRS